MGQPSCHDIKLVVTLGIVGESGSVFPLQRCLSLRCGIRCLETDSTSEFHRNIRSRELYGNPFERWFFYVCPTTPAIGWASGVRDITIRMHAEHRQTLDGVFAVPGDSGRYVLAWPGQQLFSGVKLESTIDFISGFFSLRSLLPVGQIRRFRKNRNPSFPFFQKHLAFFGIPESITANRSGIRKRLR